MSSTPDTVLVAQPLHPSATKPPADPAANEAAAPEPAAPIAAVDALALCAAHGALGG